MIELLFAMIIMATLTAIAIPSLEGSNDAAIVTSMRNDAANAINSMNNGFSLTQDYTLVSQEGKTEYTDSNNDGIADTDLLTGGKIFVTGSSDKGDNYNRVLIYTYNDKNCFKIVIANYSISTNVKYDGCNGAKIYAY